MSFVVNKNVMEEGDTVLLYLGYDNFAQIRLTRGQVHQNRFGAIKHDRLIGLPYGVKVDCPKGWVYPLQPTPELWTLALPHRTQILYTPDISMIVLKLYLKPGSVVVEAGTGSGSLSHALIRSVMPTGRLHTFEFHKERCLAATKEFEEHGLADFVTATHRDVCVEGFGLAHEADAVFLDLPAPWECIIHARNALKAGGRICTFSPCIEQVQRTCEGLTENGFTDLNTLECLARPFTVHNVKLPTMDFGDEVATEDKDKTISSHEHMSSEPPAKVAKREGDSDNSAGEIIDDNRSVTVDSGNTDDSQSVTVDSRSTDGKQSVTLTVGSGKNSNPQIGQSRHRGKQFAGRKFQTGAPPLVMQGHTGFLTFASFY